MSFIENGILLSAQFSPRFRYTEADEAAYVDEQELHREATVLQTMRHNHPERQRTTNPLYISTQSQLRTLREGIGQYGLAADTRVTNSG